MITKKIKVIILLLVLSITSGANAIDLNSIGGDTNNTTNTTDTDSTDNANSTLIEISNMEVVFDNNTLPADGNSETSLFIKVNNNNNESLSDKDVKLNIDILDNDNNDKGEIKDIQYDNSGQLFNVKYIAGNVAGNITFKITATALNDANKKLSNIEDYTLTEYTPPVTAKETSNTDSILSNLDEENIKDTESKIDNPIENEEGINIIGNKVIDENRIKITFDKTIFLPDDPLSLVDITKVSDKTKVKIANITLSEDKLSLIVLTKDSLQKEPYLVTIKEVIDGKTKKKVSVINSELTVTGINEFIILFLGLLSILGMLVMRRKKY